MMMEGEQGERQQEILAATDGLSQEQVDYYKDIFSVFDRNGTGNITAGDIGQVMRSLGWSPTEVEVQEMISEIDQDGNSQINFNEFVWLMTREIYDQEIENEIRDAFIIFDKEGHGFISSSDLSNVLQSLGEKLTPEETEEFINEADLDGDGAIYYEEFITMLFRNTTKHDN